MTFRAPPCILLRCKAVDILPSGSVRECGWFLVHRAICENTFRPWHSIVIRDPSDGDLTLSQR